MSRVVAVLAAIGAAALITGCAGSGQASPSAARSTSAPSTPLPNAHASLVAEGAARVCGSLRPAVSRIATMKPSSYSEVNHYATVVGGLGQQAYRGPGENAVQATLLNQAATLLGEAAISSQWRYLNQAQDQLQQAVRLCAAPRPDHDRTSPQRR